MQVNTCMSSGRCFTTDSYSSGGRLSVPSVPSVVNNSQMTRREWLILAALCIVVAISRWYALSTSQLDWDESLFMGGVRDYDVTQQRPHPPGYPLFILAAKLVHIIVNDNFRSLQAVAAMASLLLFPATFFLVRQLGFAFRVAISGAIVTVFVPTVWYYGGTALSDIPALTAIIAASALLLARKPRMWIAGMFLAGIAGGIRPAHVLIAIAPAVLGALAIRKTKPILLGCAVFAMVIFAGYFGAAMASANPPFGYFHQLGVTAHHIGHVDSFNNATRPPLGELAPMFFVYSHRGGKAGLVLLALAAIGVVNRRSPIILAMFLPIAIVSWMMFDTTAVTRYGLAYAMLFSLLAVVGIDRIFRRATPAIAAILVIALIVWTRPALAIVRHQPSPPIAAMRWIRAHVAPHPLHLYLAAPLGYHADYELANYDRRLFEKYDEIPPDAYVAGNYCVVDRLTIQPHAVGFHFPHSRLAEIARDSYFDASITPMESMIRFGDGWYQDEWNDARTRAWKWMGMRSTTLFPPIAPRGVLTLQFHLPLDALPRPAQLQILWNGQVIDRSISGDLENVRRYVLASRSDGPNECRIAVDEAAHAPGDPRDLSLELYRVSWEPLR